MKKTLVALALVVATSGVFAQTTPAKSKAHSAVKTVKADSTKKMAAPAKKTVKSAAVKKAN